MVETVTVETVTDERRFDDLEPAWTALYDSAGVSPFQSFAWQRAWWRHYGEIDPARRLSILVVRAGDRVTAIAPLFVDRPRLAGVLPVTQLRLLGGPTSDYLDLLVDEGMATTSLDALARHLRRERRRFDVLVLTDVPDHSSTLAEWLRALETHGLEYRKVACDTCPRVPLGRTWEETEASLPPATRGKMRRRLRHLAQRHDAQLELADDPATLDDDLAQLMRLHQERWTAVGQPGVFADEVFARFLNDAARAMARQGQLILAFLRLDGRRAGGLVGFRHHDEFHFYHGGLGDPGEASRYSPGIALHLLTMRAMQDSGVQVYDLLRGTEPYKADLGGVPTPTWRVTVTGRRGNLGRWPHLAHSLQLRARDRIDHERAQLEELRADRATGPGDVRRHLTRRVRANMGDMVARLRHPW